MSFPDEPQNAKMSREDAARFLVQASFGPTPESIAELQELGYEQWLLNQFEMPLGMNVVDRYRAHVEAGGPAKRNGINAQFWENAMRGEDQLRWRTTLAFSQIVVISFGDSNLFQMNESMGNYLQLLRDQSLGNYCDLVRDVSMRPLMGLYLSSIGNEKTDPDTGFAPDENYARELMQLFTIGLEELNMDGTPTGRPTYQNRDVEELAEVFTGFSIANPNGPYMPRARDIDDSNGWERMVGHPIYHEPGPKEFLNTVVNLGAQPEASFDAAIEHIFNHPSMPPFIAKQLIQKLVLSNPSPAYVRRVAEAFATGRYRMPSGTTVGQGRRCDMKATLAAILMDNEARDRTLANDPEYGKVRSSLLRFAHLYRVFGNVERVSTQGRLPDISHLGFENDIYNMPFMRADSVFSFYRPGFAAPGSEAARRGLVAPEMSLLTTTHLVNMTDIVRTSVKTGGGAGIISRFDPPRYLELARDIDALAEELDILLGYGALEPETMDIVREVMGYFGSGTPAEELTDEQLGRRLQYAVATIMTSPEFIVQR